MGGTIRLCLNFYIASFELGGNVVERHVFQISAPK